MNGDFYIFEVALLGISVVVIVLVAMIFLVKIQAMIVDMLAGKKSEPGKGAPKRPEPSQQQTANQVQGEAQPTATSAIEGVSPQEVAAITAAIYMLVQRPVRIANIKVIPPRTRGLG